MAKLGNLPLSYRPVRRLVALYTGLGMYGFSTSLMIAAGLGMDPWDVFHQGVAGLIGVKFGWVTIAVGAIVLLGWIPLRQRPGLGTVSNVLLIGLVINATSTALPEPHSLVLRWTYGLGSIVLTGIATGLYLGARVGPGPRDGLMTGLVERRHGMRYGSIRVVRTSIEVTVLIAGWLMGGTVGWITLLYAVGIGPLAHVMLPLLAVSDPPVAIPDGATVAPDRDGHPTNASTSTSTR